MNPPDVGAAAGRTFIILNPAAGQEDPSRLLREVGGAFAARQAPFDLVLTERRGHATELARKAVERGYGGVCVAGGDGTLAEVAAGLAGSSVPLAVLPRGTGNQVAQNLNIPIDLEAAVDVAVHGVPTPMDLGRINGRTFALVAGAGYDAGVMAAATRELKERWGFGAYVYAAVKEALTAEPTEFHIEADGRAIDLSAVSVLVANMGELFTQYLPFRLPLAPRPTRSWQDGHLDLVIIAAKSVTGFAHVLWRAARREFAGDKHLIHLQARQVSITAEPTVPVQVDGDAVGHTPVRAAVLEQSLRVRTPAARTAPPA